MSPAQTPCILCPLASLPAFRRFDAREVDFVWRFKVGELRAAARATILEEGSHGTHLYTLLSGWAFRYKTLEDRRRQILNYLVPGDLLGLQGALMADMQHSVEALTPVTLCVFERERLSELFTRHPGLAYDVTWLASREERMLDEHLLSVGRRTALERAAYLFAYLGRRARDAGLIEGNALVVPITQQQVADTLGLSLVHTNKTLRRLADRNLVTWRDRGCDVHDIEALAETAGWTPAATSRRPYI